MLVVVVHFDPYRYIYDIKMVKLPYNLINSLLIKSKVASKQTNKKLQNVGYYNVWYSPLYRA